MADDGIKKLKESIYTQKTSAWARADHKAVEQLAGDYMTFLPEAKTERSASREIVRRLEQAGFRDVTRAKSVQRGDRLYIHYRHKAVLGIVIGEHYDSVRIIGSHLDSPRLDLKPSAISESKSLAYFKTHYYGGVKKYQWTNTDLALHGVIHTKEGEPRTFALGEAQGEPRFLVSDLLPHLAQKQLEKNGKELVEAEQLCAYAMHIPHPLEGDESSVKLALLTHLNETYGLVEDDFSYAELSLVPAGGPSEIGFDKALIASYGHDDKVCAYTSLIALIETEDPQHTAVALWIDKEEIGSDGDTGAQSFALARMLEQVYDHIEGDHDVMRILHDARALSADVTAAYDANFPDVHDETIAPHLGRGIVLEKYTGSGGKYSANDASAEYLNDVRHVMNAAGVSLQASGGLGKVDLGGGGTIAKFLSRYGVLTVDAGPAVLGMHAPREILSKVDLYETYRAYKAFWNVGG